MHSQIHGRSRRRSPDIPWLLIATILGIVVVVIIAVVFFSGWGGSAAGSSSSSSSGQQAATTTKSSSSTATPTIVIATTTPVTVSSTGVSIKVEYLGSFSGTYTANGETQKIKNSGTKVYEIDSATGTVTATFTKGDSSTHALTVSIYNNGNLVATQSTSAANGSVTATATV
ncbi:MAG: hypothetical protein LUQ31_05575 [Methanoregula sp.]|nr:hypothetical protein [Methanoregula sp.]